MDPWNPVIAETHVKHVSVWRVLAAEALGILFVLVFGWAILAVALQLDLLTPFFGGR